MSLRRHWNSLFAGRRDGELGWYEEDLTQSLGFLERVPEGERGRIFLPGAGTSLLVDELLARGHELILNDISDQALARLRARVGEREGVTWLRHDISRPLPEGVPDADVWIDRAVLHFLLAEAEIEGYFANLKSVLREGGHVLLAEFSSEGATRCAGLDVHRYSLDEMTERLGEDFVLLRHEHYTYVNPFGDERPYLYALYRRDSRADAGARGGDPA